MAFAVTPGYVLRPVAGDYEAEDKESYEYELSPAEVGMRFGRDGKFCRRRNLLSITVADDGESDERKCNIQGLTGGEAEQARRIFTKYIHGNSKERVKKEKEAGNKSPRQIPS